MFKYLNSLVQRLANANEKEFKGQKPDCCTVNRSEEKLLKSRPTEKEENKK